MTLDQISNLTYVWGALVFGLFVGSLIAGAKIGNLQASVKLLQANVRTLQDQVRKLQDKRS